MKKTHEELTQSYSTWGDKLLQHVDVLYNLQKNKVITPITIQLAPTEVCNSDCPFCSVAGRPIKSSMPWEDLRLLLFRFWHLGAKSLEITGGGNPLLYRDKECNKDINDIIEFADKLGYDIGIITNSHNLKVINPSVHKHINWIRLSLIQLDERKNPEDYDFAGFPVDKIGFSYIIYDSTNGVPDELSRTNKPYKGTTPESIDKIAKLVELHPEIKFVRIAGNCLIKGNNATVRDTYKPILDKVDKYGKFFIKDIGNDDSPFDDGCYVGGIRPYIAPHPEGGDYQIYICTSHVLHTRNYDLNYSLGSINDVYDIWKQMSVNLDYNNRPYEVNRNAGKNWCKTCNFCYYKNNNKLLHTVVNDMPDKNFP